MKKQIQVTIGIPAFNEEANIHKLLTGILKQKETRFTLREVLVLSDRSTDKTDQIVLSMRDKRIKLIVNHKRLGNAQNINKILRLATGDIVALFDADITLEDTNTLYELVAPLLKEDAVAMTSGLSWPHTAKTFVEEAIHLPLYAYGQMRLSINGGNNIFSCVGTSIALSKKLFKNIEIPQDVYVSDAFLYFSCIKNNYKFQFTPKAIVRFYSPKTFSEHIQQNARFVNSFDNILPYFGEIVTKEITLPRFLLLKYTVKVSMKKPLHASVIFLVNAYCKLITAKQLKVKPVWVPVTSTKGRTTYA